MVVVDFWCSGKEVGILLLDDMLGGVD